MKKILSALLVAGSVIAVSQSYAATDDQKWIARCISDNKGEGAQPAVVRKYCECMTNEMSDNETLSVSAWEKKNPKVRDMCSKKAGWK